MFEKLRRTVPRVREIKTEVRELMASSCEKVEVGEEYIPKAR